MGCASWEKAEELHRKEESVEFHQDLLSSLKMRAESEERPEQKICCRPGDEIGGLGLWEGRFVISLLAAGLVRVACGLLESVFWSWRLGQSIR